MLQNQGGGAHKLRYLLINCIIPNFPHSQSSLRITRSCWSNWRSGVYWMNSIKLLPTTTTTCGGGGLSEVDAKRVYLEISGTLMWEEGEGLISDYLSLSLSTSYHFLSFRLSLLAITLYLLLLFYLSLSLSLSLSRSLSLDSPLSLFLSLCISITLFLSLSLSLSTLISFALSFSLSLSLSLSFYLQGVWRGARISSKDLDEETLFDIYSLLKKGTKLDMIKIRQETKHMNLFSFRPLLLAH